MPRDQRDLDEEEERELDETPEEVPPGWRLGSEATRAIEGGPHRPEEAEKGASGIDGRDTEEARLDTAAERLRGIKELEPETWHNLDEYEKRVTLDRAGRELMDVYHSPNPDVLLVDSDNANERGSYSDDDYLIKVNAAAELDQSKLLGDDPDEALRTYAHEYRHSYQREQATALEHGFQVWVDDPDQAIEWSQNLRPGNYVSPEEDYDRYRDQPVERDARDFADRLVKRMRR